MISSSWASDLSPASFAFLGEAFRATLARTGPGLCIEAGTRLGGSAQLMLEILRESFPVDPPMLWTIDPYGCKPYRSGTAETSGSGLYGNVAYVAMKTLLAPYPNHAHFFMESGVFLRDLTSESHVNNRVNNRPYWYTGRRIEPDVVFALLDGDHDANSILIDFEHLRKLMVRGGAILVDNYDADPETAKHVNTDRFGEFSCQVEARTSGEAQALFVKR